MTTAAARRHRRRLAAAAAAVVVVGAMVGGWWWRPASGPPVASTVAPTTTIVSRQTLIDLTTVPGTLAYGPEQQAESRQTGTVTAVTAAGRTVARGGVLFRVDDRPVVVLYGTMPSYRDLTAGRAAARSAADRSSAGGRGSAPAVHGFAAAGKGSASAGSPPGAGGDGSPARDPGAGTERADGASGAAVPATTGADVKQFEENLKALGYSGFTVDKRYTAATAAAVRRWQGDLGLPRTGVVELGRVLYTAGPIRVARHKLVPGAVAAGPVLAFTSAARRVTAKLKQHDQSLAKIKTKVTVAMPNGEDTPGTVLSVNWPDAEQAAGGEEPTLDVVVGLADGAAVKGLDDGPVRVRFVAERRTDVLVVPVGALLALSAGGYGLQVVDGDATRIVAVTTGLFADGNVEVSGPDIREGLTVGMAK